MEKVRAKVSQLRPLTWLGKSIKKKDGEREEKEEFYLTFEGSAGVVDRALELFIFLTQNVI